MEGGPLMRQLASAQCRSRQARDHALGLSNLRGALP